MAFDWLWVTFVIESVASERPELVEPLLTPHFAEAAQALSRNQSNTSDDVDAFMSAVGEHAPKVLSLILDAVAPAKAEAAWVASACRHTRALRRRPDAPGR
jgi:hypothetical protein